MSTYNSRSRAHVDRGAAGSRSNQTAGNFALDPNIMVVLSIDIGIRQVHLALIDCCAAAHLARQSASGGIGGYYMGASQFDISDN